MSSNNFRIGFPTDDPRRGMAGYIASQLPDGMVTDITENVITVVDTRERQYTVTVEKMYAATDTSPLPDLDNPVTDSTGYLPCGCLGSQRDHTCTIDYSAEVDNDDDGDDDEQPADGESFDGGFGQGSWFQHAMRKDD